MVSGIFLNLRENHLKNNYSYLLLIFFNLRYNEKIEIFATFHLTFYQICCSITDVVKQHVCIAQLDRALGYGPRCRGFESSCARDKSCLNHSDSFFSLSHCSPIYSSTFSGVSSLSRTIVIMIMYLSTSFNISFSNCDFIFSGYACSRKCTL